MYLLHSYSNCKFVFLFFFSQSKKKGSENRIFFAINCCWWFVCFLFVNQSTGYFVYFSFTFIIHSHLWILFLFCVTYLSRRSLPLSLRLTISDESISKVPLSRLWAQLWIQTHFFSVSDMWIRSPSVSVPFSNPFRSTPHPSLTFPPSASFSCLACKHRHQTIRPKFTFNMSRKKSF